MSSGPRTIFVGFVLAACAAGALLRLSSLGGEEDAVEMTAQQIVRVRGGQSLVVLAEKNGSRRLAVPVTRAEAALVDDALRGTQGPFAAAVDALGGRVLRGAIDGALSLRDFRGHLSVASGAREIRLETSAGQALSLALQAGAAIVVDRALLEAAGVSPEELRGKRAHQVGSASAPPPALGI
jgi:hypothetical protein